MDNTTTNVQGREIKFRAWDNVLKYMVPDFDNWIDFKGNYWTTPDKGGDTPHQEIVRGHNYILMQFTGLRDKSGKEIYEKDIFRVEEQESKLCDQCDGCGWYEGGPAIQTQCEHCYGTGQIEEADRHYYLVIVWVKEWCMFCTLSIEEYHGYLATGVKALDEPMFWTYTLEDTDSRKFFLCGNIYEHPHLLKPEGIIAEGLIDHGV